MTLPCVTEKHLDGLEVALLILSQRKEKTTYENEQLLSFMVKVIKRNRDELWEDVSKLLEEMK